MKNEKNVLTTIFGKSMSEEETIRMIMQDESAWREFSLLSVEQKQPLLEFFMGKSSLLITYDSFFKEILSPEKHPERLESFLNTVMGEKVKIKEVLPREGQAITEDSSLVIMDLLVEIGKNRIVNLEMQKVGLYFPGERSEVYTADLIMRQYTRIKNLRGKEFQYSDMAPVYIIVMMDKSAKEFLKENVCDHYIHRRQINYDSGVELKSLENITYISLDTFRKKLQNKGIRSRQDAWLTFFSSVRAEDIVELINKFPEFREYYSDIAAYRRNPGEVIRMYSEAIAFLDKNTVKYMVEDMTNQLAVLKKDKEEIEIQMKGLEEKRADLETQNKDLETQNKDLEIHNKDLETQKAELESRNKELETKDKDLEERIRDMEEQNRKLMEENERLRKS